MMKMNLEHSLARIYENAMIEELRICPEPWCITQTYEFLQSAYKLDTEHNIAYKGHPTQFAKIYRSYIQNEK